jgi:hypothetical protein
MIWIWHPLARPQAVGGASTNFRSEHSTEGTAMTITTDPTAAILAHHEHLEAELGVLVEAVVTAARDSAPAKAAVDDLTAFLRTEIVPHARAEEDVLYAAAPASDPLVAGMIFEHETILELIAALEAAPTSVDAAAAAASIRAVFCGHVRRENELLLPALTADSATDFPAVVAAMAQRFGAYQAAAR